MLPDVMHSEGHITWVIFLPEMQNLNLLTGKHQTNPPWATIYKISDLYSSKMIVSWESKKSPSSIFSLKITKEKKNEIKKKKILKRFNN